MIDLLYRSGSSDLISFEPIITAQLASHLPSRLQDET
jgi:hypothetical protein